MRNAAVVVVLALLPAGCSGVVPGGDEAVDDGTVHVYVSDEAGAIGEFEHLNVTITSFSLRSAEPADGHDDDGHHRHHHDGNWTTYEINETTVDLTRLQGANASLLHAVDVPDGEYTAVSVEVADVNATLKNGEAPEVTVPNDRLVVPEAFTVGNNESVEFVVDAVVKERQENETYVIKPNLGASGTGVEVRCDCETHQDCDDHHHNDGDHHDGGHHHDGTRTDHESGHHHDGTRTNQDGCHG